MNEDTPTTKKDWAEENFSRPGAKNLREVSDVPWRGERPGRMLRRSGGIKGSGPTSSAETVGAASL